LVHLGNARHAQGFRRDVELGVSERRCGITDAADVDQLAFVRRIDLIGRGIDHHLAAFDERPLGLDGVAFVEKQHQRRAENKHDPEYDAGDGFDDPRTPGFRRRFGKGVGHEHAPAQSLAR
jgi:hypothetical protein